MTAFQNAAGFVAETIADAEIELQPAAMKALLKARDDAQEEALDITPRGGPEAARRNYEDSMRLWDTRFLPALDYWLVCSNAPTSQAPGSSGRILPVPA